MIFSECMGRRRFKITQGVGWYHVMTRIVGGEKFLGEDEKRVLGRQIRYLADFCGVKVLTHAMMDNHFHLLLEIHSPAKIDDAELLRRIGVLYGVDRYLAIKTVLEGEDKSKAEEIREQYLQRMGDVSVFMKELKQRFSRWFNQTHQRFGTLWAERFKSVLVEGKRHALATVAAYIDLNGVRAGLVKDPGQYRYCGYGEALRGIEEARQGICRLAETTDWEIAQREYRVVLFGKGSRGKFDGQGKVIDHEKTVEVLAQGGVLEESELNLYQLPGMSEGVAVGTGKFIEEVRAEYRRSITGRTMQKSWKFPLRTDLHLARCPRKTKKPGCGHPGFDRFED